MRIYIYKEKTGEYIGDYNAQPNPKRKGEFLYPPNSTTLIPPSLKENEGLIFKDEKWNIVKDYRGKEIINLKTKEISKVTEIGNIKNGYMLVSDYVQTEEYKKDLIEEDKNKRRLNLLNEISKLDNKRIRAICEPSVKNEETGETWLEFYTSQIIELRKELEEI